MQGDSRGRVPLLFLAYDDFFRSAKLNEKYDGQNPSGKRVYANEAGGLSSARAFSLRCNNPEPLMSALGH